MENNLKTILFLGALTALLVFIGGVLGGHTGILCRDYIGTPIALY